MVRVIIFAFALSLASSVQAMPVSPLQAQDDIVVSVQQACGAGFQRVAGRCVRNTAVPHFRHDFRRAARLTAPADPNGHAAHDRSAGRNRG